MTVKELIKELTENFEPNDWVRIDGDCLRISSEVCDALIKMETVKNRG
jgi:spore coat polysaccharide biosynthesis protein SpsF (cytidylyltransferase family)